MAMFSSENLPVEVQADLHTLISYLLEKGWTICGSGYDADCFGNWYVKLSHADRIIQLVKDRSHYTIEGLSAQELKIAGLWKAF